MAHKVHPKSFRIKEIGDWSSRGFYKNFPENLEEDFKIRNLLQEKIGKASLEKIEIERFPGRINVIVFSARPGLIIGRGGQDVENLKKSIEKEILKKKITNHYRRISKKEGADLTEEEKLKGKKQTELVKNQINKNEKKEVRIEIREVKNSWLSASLIAQSVAQQIEKRMPFRRIMKQTIAKASANKEIKGVKVELSGRLNGAEIARREWLSQGRLPLQTLRSDIDYAKETAHCTYGAIGVKVWLYKGEKFE
mgnify:CR=1 FL=1